MVFTSHQMLIQDKPFLITVREQSSDMVVLQEAIEDLYRFSTLAHAGQTWLDIGGNIGVSTLALVARGCDVIVYEPDEQNRKLLTQNIEQNNLQTRVQVEPFGVTGAPGKYRLDPAEDGEFWLQKLHGLKQGESETPTVTLSEIIDTHAVMGHLSVKIDIEGFEKDVLLNTPAQKLGSLQAIVFEFHHDRLTKDDFNAIVAHLKDAGFRFEPALEVVTKAHIALQEPYLVYAINKA